MANLLGEIRRVNSFGGRAIAEPFAGGAGASLSLLYGENTETISINDADPAIFDFWWTLIHRPRPFLKLLAETPVTVDEWGSQRTTYRDRRSSRLKRGFAAFYLNRCNRSGIIPTGGPIGGAKQLGSWKIDARFNKAGLHQRCKKVVDYRYRIHVSCDDAIDFLEGTDSKATFFFIDPPYYEKSSKLYLNVLDRAYHEALALKLKTLPDDSAWVLTYDDHPEIREMYDSWANVRPFTLRYSAARRREGGEVLIAPKWVDLPTSQNSAAIGW